MLHTVVWNKSLSYGERSCHLLLRHPIGSQPWAFSWQESLYCHCENGELMGLIQKQPFLRLLPLLLPTVKVQSTGRRGKSGQAAPGRPSHPPAATAHLQEGWGAPLCLLQLRNNGLLRSSEINMNYTPAGVQYSKLNLNS